MKDIAERKSKRTLALFVAVVMALTLWTAAPVAAHAAESSVQRLDHGKAYTIALQGGENHTISWDCSYTDHGKKGATVYTYIDIDGVRSTITTNGVYVNDDPDIGWKWQVQVMLASVNAHTKLICVEMVQPDNNWVACEKVYQYDNSTKRVKFVGDAIKQNPMKSDVVTYNNTDTGVRGLLKVGKNKLTFRWGDPWAHSIGMIGFDAVFTYTGQGIKASPYAKLNLPSPKKKLTVQKGFKVYTKPGGKKVKFTVKKGDKIKALQIKSFKKNRYYIQLKKGGKKGWLRASKSSSQESILFKGRFMAV
jgi:hypothetical protein